jgi:hypothetical protein
MLVQTVPSRAARVRRLEVRRRELGALNHQQAETRYDHAGQPASRRLLLRDIYLGRVRAALEHHLQALGTESDDEILAVRDDGHADATGQRPPFPQLEDVFRDVRFVELAAVFPQPILDEVAVGSSWRSVNLDRGHGTSRSAVLIVG